MQVATRERKSDRLVARVTPEDKALFERAAVLEGCSVGASSGLMSDRRKKFVAKLFHAEPRQCRVEAIEVFAVIAKFPARLGQAFGFKAALGLLAV